MIMELLKWGYYPMMVFTVENSVRGDSPGGDLGAIEILN